MDEKPSELERIHQAVEKVYAEHVKDPKLIALSETAVTYTPGGRREFPRPDEPRWLLKSLNHCHSVNQALLASNDDLRRVVIRVQQKLDWERNWRWGIVATVVAGLIGEVLLQVFRF